MCHFDTLLTVRFIFHRFAIMMRRRQTVVKKATPEQIKDKITELRTLLRDVVPDESYDTGQLASAIEMTYSLEKML